MLPMFVRGRRSRTRPVISPGWARSGQDNSVDRQAVRGTCLGRAGDGHPGSSAANLASGPLLDVSADNVEHEVNAADVIERVVPNVDELHGAESSAF